MTEILFREGFWGSRFEVFCPFRNKCVNVTKCLDCKSFKKLHYEYKDDKGKGELDCSYAEDKKRTKELLESFVRVNK